MTHETRPMVSLSLVTLLAAAIAGCSSTSETPKPPARPDAGVVTPPVEVVAPGESVRADLRWKRYRVLQRDLARGLALDPQTLCRELGAYPCATIGPLLLTDFVRSRGYPNVESVCAFLQGKTRCEDGTLIEVAAPRGVHVTALGGNDPFFREQYEPVEQPNAASVLALDRLVLSACAQAVDRDAAGMAQVFTGVDLRAAALSPSDPGTSALVTTLYRRLLARDPVNEETAAVAELASGSPPPSASEFAKLACFSIATTAEFVWQ